MYFITTGIPYKLFSTEQSDCLTYIKVYDFIFTYLLLEKSNFQALNEVRLCNDWTHCAYHRVTCIFTLYVDHVLLSDYFLWHFKLPGSSSFNCVQRYMNMVVFMCGGTWYIHVCAYVSGEVHACVCACICKYICWCMCLRRSEFEVQSFCCSPLYFLMQGILLILKFAIQAWLAASELLGVLAL